MTILNIIELGIAAVIIAIFYKLVMFILGYEIKILKEPPSTKQDT